MGQLYIWKINNWATYWVELKFAGMWKKTTLLHNNYNNYNNVN